MPLMRGYTEVDDEGKIAIPRNIRRQAGLGPGRLVGIIVIRVKGTGRRPHLIIHNPDDPPRISPLEAVMMQGLGEVGAQGKIFLAEDIRSEARFEPGHFIEIKVQGGSRTSWIAVYMRGPKRLSTLQARMGRRERGKKKDWRTMPVEY